MFWRIIPVIVSIYFLPAANHLSLIMHGSFPHRRDCSNRPIDCFAMLEIWKGTSYDIIHSRWYGAAAPKMRCIDLQPQEHSQTSRGRIYNTTQVSPRRAHIFRSSVCLTNLIPNYIPFIKIQNARQNPSAPDTWPCRLIYWRSSGQRRSGTNQLYSFLRLTFQQHH